MTISMRPPWACPLLQAATALSSMLISARLMPSRSSMSGGTFGSVRTSNRILRCPSRNSTTASSTSSFRSSGRWLPAGSRANVENSFTSVFRSSTCLTMVRVHSSKTSSRNHVCVALLQPLRGELNRRQRILDLVGDALRDLAPRLHALDLENLRDVLEEQHGAWRSIVARGRVAQRRRRGEQREGLVRLHDLDLALALGRAGRQQLAQHLAHRFERGPDENLCGPTASRLRARECRASAPRPSSKW